MAKFASGAVALTMASISVRARSGSLTSRTISIQPIPVPDRTILPAFFSTRRCSILSLNSRSCFDARSSPGHLMTRRRFLPAPPLTDAGGSPSEQLPNKAKMMAQMTQQRPKFVMEFQDVEPVIPNTKHKTLNPARHELIRKQRIKKSNDSCRSCPRNLN
jgi:hypothetical protein